MGEGGTWGRGRDTGGRDGDSGGRLEHRGEEQIQGNIGREVYREIVMGTQGGRSVGV